MTVVRRVVRDEITKHLKDATVVRVDELLDEFLMPTSAIAELRSTSKPGFSSLTRRPQFRAVQFPERDARPRDPNGRLQKRPFSDYETFQLYFFHEVPIPFPSLGYAYRAVFCSYSFPSL